jgi:hypothetical protein
MCDIPTSKITDIKSNSVESTTFANEDHPGIEIKDLNLKWCVWKRIATKSGRIHDCIFRRCLFDHCYFRDVKFRNVNFTGSFFSNCNLSKVNFEACNFWYVRFSKCVINYDEILQSTPPETNIALFMLQSLRQNALEMGDKKAADRIVIKEISFHKKELWNRISAKTNYYKTRFDTLRRMESFLKLLGLLMSGLILGYGLKLRNLIFSALATIVVFALVFSGLGSFASQGNLQTPLKLGFGMSLYLSTITFTTLGYGDYAPSNTVSYLFCSIESFLGIIFLGFFAATVYRRFSR